ncbi:Nuclear envelope morphology protein 1 [Coemansia sp. RSA 1813]|nr:Nuclear envelope morphology protein 1 [Coemansia sp. RSA 1646]KAJ1767924.1 Nuclear envelope morphology protein 1 [Coemansia sp. RSA 1843]KAJ2086488.1 Nuclear envelope morphology protein 1 [Coemansia sp. RSA 986]KAJ2213496.1 Nuclear envelope morphology protein 1 [Coemansia sp. RSA 487]KAJ2564836.1 Nuclear envelope morphology protein 1 [Coemansia sp. RSA 1813]
MTIKERKGSRRFSVLYFGLLYVYTLLFGLLESIPYLDSLLAHLPQPQNLVSDTYQPISDKASATDSSPKRKHRRESSAASSSPSLAPQAGAVDHEFPTLSALSWQQQKLLGLPALRRRRASSAASSSTTSSIGAYVAEAGATGQISHGSPVSMTGAAGGGNSSGGGGSSGLVTRSLKKKTLVLDLDETLIHSSPQGSYRAHHRIEVVIDKVACLYYVYKRPHVDFFLRKVSEWYKVVVFTASLAEYADPVIDLLDVQGKFISGRYFREACIPYDSSYAKDLAYVDPDLSQIVLVDNSPLSYFINPTNGIPIQPWINSDPKDEALLDLLPLLDALRFTDDVRSVLSLRLV